MWLKATPIHHTNPTYGIEKTAVLQRGEALDYFTIAAQGHRIVLARAESDLTDRWKRNLIYFRLIKKIA